MPATVVRSTLSATIWDSIMRGVAPMARRMPISDVRSFTVTIMMLDTPTEPASNVPMPTSHTRKFTPENKLSSMAKSTSVLKTMIPCSSVGST